VEREEQSELAYGRVRLIAGQDFASVRERVVAALTDEGFGVLTEIDVQATLKKKLDEDVPAQVILGACNPPLAHRALQAEPDLGLMLPCNVVVREVDGGVQVATIAPEAMFGVVDNRGLQPVMEEVDQRLRRVLKALD